MPRLAPESAPLQAEVPGAVQGRVAKSGKDSMGRACLRVSGGILSASRENVLG